MPVINNSAYAFAGIALSNYQQNIVNLLLRR